MTFRFSSVTFIILSLFLLTSTAENEFKKPPNFPDSINVTLTEFKNWGENIQIKNVWTVEPKNVQEIVQVANWARQNGYQVRASGLMQNWSPLTLTAPLDESSSQPPSVILIKTATNLNSMKVMSNEPGRSTFWAETGITMDKLVSVLESRNLELRNLPAMGQVTLGGVLATGSHGSGVPSQNEGPKYPDGYTYGTLSNLIISLTAIVYCKKLDAYTIKEFSRQDDQTAALLVNLGRVIITNVTMRARPMTVLRCESILNIHPELLLAHPNPQFTSSGDPSKSLATFLNASGMVEVILYPFTNRPWLKKWTPITKEECQNTKESTVVIDPYNYPFLDNYPKSVGKLASDIQNGSFQRAEIIGPLLLDVTVESLELSQSWDMCGPSKNTLLYIQPSSLKFSSCGWAILTNRANVQRVFYETYQFYKYLLYSFAAQQKFPINGPISFKISAVDDPTDVGVNGAQAPSLSPTFSPRPSSNSDKLIDNDFFDTVVWFDISTFAKTPNVSEFMSNLENHFMQVFNGEWALLKGDLSKGWGYSKMEDDSLTLLNGKKTQGMTSPIKQTEDALKTLNALDPFQVFTNSYLRTMLIPKENVAFCSQRIDGRYLNTRDCGKFYNCVNGSTQLIQCPPPLHFSLKDKRCDTPEDAKCEGTIFFPELDSFPLPLIIKKFKNWSGEMVARNVWAASPKSGQDVVLAANWARSFRFELRPTGFRHTWAPFTIARGDFPGSVVNELEPDPPEVRPEPVLKSSTDNPGNIIPPLIRKGTILMDTRDHLNNMGIISAHHTNASFWAQTGISMEVLLKKLEYAELGLMNHPAPGELTLGGVLAIGGHGTGVNATAELRFPGHSYGSLSNLIVAFTAVVFDEKEDKYVLKDFHRSDPEAKAFLVSLGRAFITNVTMRAGPLLYIRCVSTTRVNTSEIFASPEKAGPNSFSNILDRTGRAETVLFPFKTTPWLKIWQIVQKKEMIHRREIILPHLLPFLDPSGDLGISKYVPSPYNYPFADYVPDPILQPLKAVGKCPHKGCTAGAFDGFWMTVQAGLLGFGVSDIWGESKNVMLYVKPTTMKVTANGYAVITSRENIQKAVHLVYKLYDELMESYASKAMFPMNCAMEMRMTSVDRADEVGVDGAESPALGPSAPVEGHSSWDTVIWVNMLSIPGTQYANNFYQEFEDRAYNIFDGEWATIRVEWCKGWGYRYGQVYESEDFKDKLSKTFPTGIWNFTVNTLKKYDPYGVFSNDFLNKLLVPR